MIPIEQQRIVSLFTVILTAGKNLSVATTHLAEYPLSTNLSDAAIKAVRKSIVALAAPDRFRSNMTTIDHRYVPHPSW
jgi:hypothetical protein